MKISLNNETIEIPDSFFWVMEYMYQWYKENKTGDLRLVYKCGGIAGLEPKEYIKPNEKNT